MTPRQALLLLLALVGVAYVGALQAGFVWDDVPLVLRNRLTGDLANLPQFFAMDLWDGSPVDQGVSGYYRPLFLVSLAVDRALFGLSSVGAHAQSLLWHGIAVVLAFHLLRGWLGVERAFAAALVFGLHPIQSEAVIWVAARNDPMAAALGLGALCCLRAERPGPLAWAGAALLTLLAGLTKESVVLLPALGLVLDLGQGRRPTLFRASPLLLGLGLALGMRALAGVGGATWPEESGWRLLIAESPRLFGLLGSWLVWPAPLSAAHTLEWLDRSSALRIGLGALAGLGLLGAGLWPGETARARRAGLAWTALCLGPVLVPIADKGLVGERYAYLPLLGVGLLVAAALPASRAAWIGLLGLPAALAIGARCPDWRDDLSLWASAVEATPSPYASASYALALREAGRAEEALPFFVAALDDPLPYREACPRLLGTLIDLGRPGVAVQRGRWAKGQGCAGGAFRGQLARAYLLAGGVEEARAELVGAPPDPEGRAVVVAAALHLLDGDEGAFALLEAAEPAEAEPLRRRAERLLVSAGLAALPP
jgi:hypothetical protein